MAYSVLTILDQLGGNILSEKSTARLVAGPGNKWPEMVVEWKRRSTALLREGFRFDGAASVQPGMAFGQVRKPFKFD